MEVVVVVVVVVAVPVTVVVVPVTVPVTVVPVTVVPVTVVLVMVVLVVEVVVHLPQTKAQMWNWFSMQADGSTGQLSSSLTPLQKPSSIVA